MKTAAWIGILALATAGVAACGDDETGDAATSGTTTTTTSSASGTGAAGGAGGAGGATTSSSSAGGAGGGQGGAGGGQGGAGGSGLLPFGSTCTNNAECESGICNSQQMGMMVCTIMCQEDADCPPPMDCNMSNHCKV